jgi:HlyD family secretion protein
MGKRWQGILLAIIILGALGYWAFTTYLIRPSNKIEASGTIETTEVDVSFQAAGKVQERLVQEGDRVVRGQIVARLDLQPLRESLERARAQLEAAKLALHQARDFLSWSRRTVEEQEKAARAAAESTQARYQEVKTGPRAQEILQVEAALAAAEATYSKAKLDVERARELVKKNVYSQAALDAAEAAFTSAKSQRESARQALNLVREGSRKEEIESAEAQLRQARATLAQATSNWMQVTIKEQDLAAAEARVQELQAAYNIAKINLEYGELRAPISGWVLQKNIEPGEVVNVGTPVVTLGDVEDLWMNVYVGEAAVGKLRLGDPVEIRVDAHPNQVFSGRIIFISQEAEFTPKNIQTKDERTKLVYRVKVSIRNNEQKLKPGMPADAVLQVHS